MMGIKGILVIVLILLFCSYWYTNIGYKYLFLGYFRVPFHSNNDVTQRSGQIFMYCGTFEKRVKAKFSNVSYTLFFTGIKHFSSGISFKPMLMYDQGIVGKDTKNEKTDIFCFNHVYGSLRYISCTSGDSEILYVVSSKRTLYSCLYEVYWYECNLIV